MERILAGDDIEPKRIRKAAVSVASYLLRAIGRSTSFGLLAGVALARVGPSAATIGTAHQAAAHADTSWVAHVRRDLEGRADVLPFLRIHVSTLAFRSGDTLNLTQSRGRIASAFISGPLALVLRAAEAPTTGRRILQLLTQAGGTREQAHRLISQALADGYLTSSLMAPMTGVDPVGHIVRTLEPTRRRSCAR
ncbi:lantibiotic dehydratase [Streptomyces sp. NPDC046324]|uniref:lantibiotic dehydratase n=1 Tax=Streptomyces sp. NPDC046324 TaxID=3154915 RepID=UPI0033CE7662